MAIENVAISKCQSGEAVNRGGDFGEEASSKRRFLILLILLRNKETMFNKSSNARGVLPLLRKVDAAHYEWSITYHYRLPQRSFHPRLNYTECFTGIKRDWEYHSTGILPYRNVFADGQFQRDASRERSRHC